MSDNGNSYSEIYTKNLENSYLYGGNAPFVEGLYEEYLSSPTSVGGNWRAYFDGLRSESGGGTETIHSRIREDLIEIYKHRGATPRPRSGGLITGDTRKQAAVLRMINAYRLLGHHRSDIDPIKLRALPFIPDLDPQYHGLMDDDFNTVFNAGTLVDLPEGTLREILAVLQQTYTGPIASEYLHITDIDQKMWIQQRLEGSRAQPDLSHDQKLRLLDRLTAAEGMETYLHKKYAGQKRFSLEGGESLICMLDELIQRSGSQGVKEIVIAMAHRGRLNVLVNIMGKAPRDLFSEFEGHRTTEKGKSRFADVKYHQGFSADVHTPGGPVHLALAFNPSHLEIVDPVAEGSTRARQDRRDDVRRKQVYPILIHGDAAFAGQGVVYETFNLAQTRGYTTGGTIHIVVNNRIGFTTSHPLDTRSTMYCTDLGKVVHAPIFHVNGDDAEAVAFVSQMAWDFRSQFKKDVIIDLVCYRRHGHNEADEPSATQPRMYKKIKPHPTTREVYAQKLVDEGTIAPDEAARMATEYRDELDEHRPVADHVIRSHDYGYHNVSNWTPYLKSTWTEPAKTGVPVAELKRLGMAATDLPEDFELHGRVQKVIDDRRKMTVGALPIDWGAAETLAYASLLQDGFAVRLSGQDSGRGTFFHRHAVLHNQRNGEAYATLEHLYPNQPRFRIIDSILSEEAVIGFEYGYSTADPDTLVIWEAQYGDFTNNAQVVIDQFISSSEPKWGLLSGLVMMLPHGWEGQGPEHSSARLERFLQLCAEENMQVCAPTTPAQMFHVLRRQMVRRYRKPLILMTPKSLLRKKQAYSTLDDLAGDGFQNVIREIDELEPAKVDRIVLCSGKIYYELVDKRREMGIDSVAIVRVEQLYPFPATDIGEVISMYPNAHEVVWTQEEPMNQGAWLSIQHVLSQCMKPDQKLSYSGRTASAAPSGADYHEHLDRQGRIIDVSLRLQPDRPPPLPIYELYVHTKDRRRPEK